MKSCHFNDSLDWQGSHLIETISWTGSRAAKRSAVANLCRSHIQDHSEFPKNHAVALTANAFCVIGASQEQRVKTMESTDIAVLGAGLSGSVTALKLAQLGHSVCLIDQMERPMLGASRHNEGKLHLGYIYAADKTGETAKLLARGSLQFFDFLADVLPVPAEQYTLSPGFDYIVPDDTALSPEALAAHLEQVDALLADYCDEIGKPRLDSCRPLRTKELRRSYDDRILAGFHTPEIAVDPTRVAELVTAAVLAHPNITFLGGCRINGAEPLPYGSFHVGFTGPDGASRLRADGCVNALWEDRVRLDEMVGLRCDLNWLQRWKATVLFDVPPRSVSLPTVTAFLGPYGDLVRYGPRRIYLSWYPALRLSLSETAKPDDVRTEVAQADKRDLIHRAIEGLSTLVPGTSQLSQFA